MHLIPASWSHLHILVSVFPSVGLIFALGFYIAALAQNDEAKKRACLFVFVGMGLLAIPTFLSGQGAQAKLASNPTISPDLMNIHYGWSMLALFFLVVTGVIALIALARGWKTPRISDNALHLVLGFSLITVLLMIVVAELGWEISHRELRFAAVDGKTSQIWSHIHIILNHFVTVGFVMALFFYITGLVVKNDAMKRSSLTAFVICAVLGAPTFVTGASAMWALTDPPVNGIAKAVINAHRDWAIFSLFGLAFTGGAAWIELWRQRYIGRFSKFSLNFILIAAVITLAVMAETGHRGGQINHPEIRIATDVLRSDPTLGLAAHTELLINNVIWFVPWQTVHFFGFAMVFATVLVVTMRVLGLWKSIPFSAVHRLLPIGVFGVMANVFTGMLMLMADTSRYVNEPAFWPKMFFLPIGAIAVLYFSLSERLWNVKAGEDAPMGAKWVAVLVLVSWTIVIMGGRLLPYITL